METINQIIEEYMKVLSADLDSQMAKLVGTTSSNVTGAAWA